MYDLNQPNQVIKQMKDAGMSDSRIAYVLEKALKQFTKEYPIMIFTANDLEMIDVNPSQYSDQQLAEIADRMAEHVYDGDTYCDAMKVAIHE